MHVLDEQPFDSYDTMLGAVGYEERCTFAATKLSGRYRNALAVDFGGDDVTSGNHRHEMEDLSFRLIAASDDIEAHVSAALTEVVEAGQPIQIAVDISSMTREILFKIIRGIQRASEQRVVAVDFWYSPAAPPTADAHDVTVPIASAEPLHPLVSGWGADPWLPLSAIVGVGIERDLALGVAEHLDVSRVHAFVPAGIHDSFDQLAEQANAEFFLADYMIRSTRYDLRQPFDLFTRVESLTYGLLRTDRVALVPLGPKIFALVSILVALAVPGPVAVWRFSEGDSKEHGRGAPIGEMFHLRAKFDSRVPPDQHDISGTEDEI